MLPSNTWNTNIYNEKLAFIKKKKLHKDNNMGVEKKIILCSFLITIICLLPFTGNDTSMMDFINQLKNFLVWTSPLLPCPYSLEVSPSQL